MENKNRCFGNRPGQELYARYHDEEWGVPVYDDRLLFEMLILEGAQAGLSFETILKRREGYRRAFYRFDPKQVAAMSDEELEALLKNEEIIRNRLKVYSTRQNAQAFLAIVEEFGSFSEYLKRFIPHPPLKSSCKSLSDLPTTSIESDALSKDLKKKGMKFVGSTIMYAYMQAIGLVDDHVVSCWRYRPPS